MHERGSYEVGASMPETNGSNLELPEGYYDSTRHELLDLVPVDARRILDVGCGAGRMGEELKRRQDAEVVGVEINPEVAEEARQRLDQVITADIEEAELPFPEGHFDCMVFGDILEHLRHPKLVLANTLRHLSEGGCIAASIPNVRNAQVITDLLEGRWQYASAGILDEGHLRFFTLEEIWEFFGECGLRTLEIRRVLDVRYDQWREAGSPVNLELGRGTVHAASPQDAAEFFVMQYLVGAGRKAASVPRTRASVIVLMHDGMASTRACLDAVQRCTQHPHELIVVDDGSAGPARNYLAKRNGLTVVRGDTNLGLLEACRRGLRVASEDCAVLLSSRTLVTPGWLSRLVQGAERHEDVGVVEAASDDVGADLPTPDMQGSAEATFKAHALRLFDADDLAGSCVLVKRAAWEQIGLLHGNSGTGTLEGRGVASQARSAGWRVAQMPGVLVHRLKPGVAVGTGGWGPDAPERDGNAPAASRPSTLPTRETGHGAASVQLQAGDQSVSAGGQGPPPPAVAQEVGSAEVGQRRSSRDVAERDAVAEAAKPASLCLIIRSEDADLSRCLERASGAGDEVMIVGAESLDQGVASSGTHGLDYLARVDEVATACEEAVKRGTCDWVMWLGPNERLTDADGQRLRLLLQMAADEVSGYTMAVSCAPNARGAITSLEQVRVVRNLPDLRFENGANEVALPPVRRLSGTIVRTGICVRHDAADHSTGHSSRAEGRRASLEEQLRSGPDDPFILFGLARLSSDIGDFEAAMEYARGTVEHSHAQDLHVGPAYAILAHACTSLGDWAGALKGCEEGRKQRPDDFDLQHNEALALYHMGMLRDAEARLLGILEGRGAAPPGRTLASTQRARTHHSLALTYIALGQPDQAQERLREAVEECPALVVAWESLGELLIEHGRSEQAETLLAEMVEQRMDGIVLDVLRARLALSAGDPVAARESLERVVTARPDHELAHRLLSDALLQIDNAEAAEDVLRRLVQLSPDDGDAWRDLATTYCQLDRFEDSVAPFEQVLRLCPTGEQAYYSLSEVHRRLGRTDAARDVLERAALELPGSARVQYELGKACREQGDLTRAQDCLRRAMQFRPGYGAARTALEEISKLDAE